MLSRYDVMNLQRTDEVSRHLHGCRNDVAKLTLLVPLHQSNEYVCHTLQLNKKCFAINVSYIEPNVDFDVQRLKGLLWSCQSTTICSRRKLQRT